VLLLLSPKQLVLLSGQFMTNFAGDELFWAISGVTAVIVSEEAILGFHSALKSLSWP